MGKAMYLGVSSKARKVKKAYIGVSSKARKIKKMYIGVSGKARLFWSGGGAGKALVFYGNYYKPSGYAYQYDARTVMTEDPTSTTYTEVTCTPTSTYNYTESGIRDIVYANDRYYSVLSNYSKSGIWYSDPAVSTWTGLVTFGSGDEHNYKTSFTVDDVVYIVLTTKSTTSSGSDASGNSGASGNYYHYYYRLNSDCTATLAATYTGSWSESSGSWGSGSSSTGYRKFVKIGSTYYTLSSYTNSSSGQGGYTVTNSNVLYSASSIGGTLTKVGSGISSSINNIDIVDGTLYAFGPSGVYKVNTSTGAFTLLDTAAQSDKTFKMSENSWLTYTYSSNYGSNTQLTLRHVTYSNGSFTTTYNTITTTPYVTTSVYPQMRVIGDIVYLPNTAIASSDIALDMHYSLDYGKTWTINKGVTKYTPTNRSGVLTAVMCTGTHPF